MIDIGKLKTLPEDTDIGKIRLSDGRWLVVSTISRISDDTGADSDNYVEFDFEGAEEADMTPEEYLKEYSLEDVAEHIKDMFDDALDNHGDESEALYDLRLFTQQLRKALG